MAIYRRLIQRYVCSPLSVVMCSLGKGGRLVAPQTVDDGFSGFRTTTSGSPADVLDPGYPVLHN